MICLDKIGSFDDNANDQNDSNILNDSWDFNDMVRLDEIKNYEN